MVNKMVNKNVGARVLVKKVLVNINPVQGWVYIKHVFGTVVEREGHEQYWFTSDGGHNNVRKNIIENDCWPNYAIKLDNDLKDIVGNNIVVFREEDIKFLDKVSKQKRKRFDTSFKNGEIVWFTYKLDPKEENDWIECTILDLNWSLKAASVQLKNYKGVSCVGISSLSRIKFFS